MKLKVESYLEQRQSWPAEGRHILAQFDADSVVVYQAYRPAIGHFAARHSYFGGEFSYGRMSWCKPNFLWMMYRSGWGTKEGQEVTFAVRLKRLFFDSLLAQAVPSAYDANFYPERAAWQEAVSASSVRLQWDPDHDPSGAPLPRRAIQLGLRGEVLQEYGRAALLGIEDISDFVAEQRANATPSQYAHLWTPAERRYLPDDSETVRRLRL